MSNSLPVFWDLWNARVLGVFGPVLIVAGVAGFLIPERLALMSGAAPYNLFHIVFGALAVGLVVARTSFGIDLFNVLFGLADLYQVGAGLRGWFPSRLFRYKPADHIVHLVLGLLLAGLGAAGVVHHLAD